MVSSRGQCKCELSGFCSVRNIELKPTLQMICRENKPRVDAMLKGEAPPAKGTSARSHKATCAREPVGTALESRIERTLKLKTGKGCGCQKLVDKMNGWGIGGCQANRKEIIDTLMVHRQEMEVSFAKAAINFASSMGVVDSLKLGAKLLRDLIEQKDASHEAELAGCNWLLDRAIEDSHPKPARRSSHKVNDKLYQEMLVAPKPEADGFTSEPVFHFGAHLWPIVGHWEHHVDKWNLLAEQITGRCFVGISECHDCGTSPTSEVIARLSDRFEVFTVPNTAEGENPTFTELMKRVPQGQNDIFLYAHGKGVKPATRVSAAVKAWVSVMYTTVIFNHREIARRMAQGYKCFGSLRAFGQYPLAPKYSWHYAGTFFAVRAKYLASVTSVKRGYGGVEAWPGDNFPANEAWCEYGDNRSIMSHYSEKEMCNDSIKESVAQLSLSYAKRHRHRKLIAVTTCNLHGSTEIRNDIRVLLDSLVQHCSSDVIVVDDGSPVEYQEYVHDLCKRRGFRFIGIWNNGGISKAKNLCLNEFMELQQYEYCFLLDDDVKVISDEFESTYTTAMERAGVGILSWNDPEWVQSTSEPDGELMASNETCGCCVVVSRECVEATGFYTVMPGKWGCEHSAYYQRAAVKFGKPGVYFDVPNSKDLLITASHASVFTFDEKVRSGDLNRAYLESQQ